MSVEVERYLMHPDGSDDSRPTITVHPGGKKAIGFLGPAINVVVNCGDHDDKAIVSVEPTRRVTQLRNLGAWVFDEDNLQGIMVELYCEPVEIHSYQKLSLVLGRGRKPAKVLDVRMSSNDGSSVWEIPQDREPLVLV